MTELRGVRLSDDDRAGRFESRNLRRVCSSHRADEEFGSVRRRQSRRILEILHAERYAFEGARDAAVDATLRGFCIGTQEIAFALTDDGIERGIRAFDPADR